MLPSNHSTALHSSPCNATHSPLPIPFKHTKPSSTSPLHAKDHPNLFSHHHPIHRSYPFPAFPRCFGPPSTQPASQIQIYLIAYTPSLIPTSPPLSSTFPFPSLAPNPQNNLFLPSPPPARQPNRKLEIQSIVLQRWGDRDKTQGPLFL